MKVENGTTVSLRLPARLIEALQQQAREVAFRERKTYVYTDLIRSVLTAAVQPVAAKPQVVVGGEQAGQVVVGEQVEQVVVGSQG